MTILYDVICVSHDECLPSGPGDPVAPTRPFDPVCPVLPDGPVDPVSPCHPRCPIAPCGPFIPVAPKPPQGPVAPICPRLPVAPETPVRQNTLLSVYYHNPASVCLFECMLCYASETFCFSGTKLRGVHLRPHGQVGTVEHL